MYGGDDVDIIHGDAGDDKIYGDDGNDQLFGDDGNDTFYFNYGGNNRMRGNGTDTVDYSAAFTGVDIRLFNPADPPHPKG